MGTITANCKNTTCKNEWHIRVVEKEGKNYFGWWIVKCSRCNGIYDIYIGPNVYNSLLISGGTILQRIDSEKFNEEQVQQLTNKFRTHK